MEKIKLNEINKISLLNKVIVFPTDTVYGIGAKIDDEIAINKIYEIKKRDKSKPLAVLIPNKDISKYVSNINEYQEKIIDDVWPGPTTIVMEKASNILDVITSKKDTIALRMPKSKIALKVLEHFGPLATTSINISGMPELNTVEAIEAQFGKKIDYIIIDKESLSKTPSTIIDITKKTTKKIR